MAEMDPSTDQPQTLQYLFQVFDVLLDRSKTVVDDTSLQRLLEYCKDLFGHADFVTNEKGMNGVFRFLEACCVTEEMTVDPHALTFGLQLIKSLSSNEGILAKLMMQSDQNVSQDEAIDHGLVVRLLQRACREDVAGDPCMKEAWLTLLYALANKAQAFWTICTQTDALRISLELLDDSSMFVAKAAQKFLARVLLLQYKKADGLNRASSSCKSSSPDDADKMSIPAEPSKNDEKEATQSALSNGSGDGLGKEIGQPNEESVCFPNGESRKRTHDEATCSQGDINVEVLKDGENNSCKKSRLSGRPLSSVVGDAATHKIQSLCRDLMSSEEAATVLACLLVDLEPCEAQLQTTLLVSKSCGHEKKTLSAVGVFRCVVTAEDCKGELSSALIDDVNMVTRCKRLLCEDGQLSQKVCNDVVEFLGCVLSFERKGLSAASVSSVLCDLESLPAALMNKQFTRPAVYLAASIFKFCSSIQERFPDITATPMKSSLSVLLAPCCVVLSASSFEGKSSLDPSIAEALQRTTVDGKTALPILSASLSALEGLVKEDHCSFSQSQFDAFHFSALFLSDVIQNPDSGNQSGALVAQYRSLIGSTRLIMSLLDLTRSSLSASSSQVDIWSLLKTLNLVLKNPDAVCRVIMKILDIIPNVLPVALSAGEGAAWVDRGTSESLLAELGHAVQKRMCNIEWEVRDSTIMCVRKLLEIDSDAQNEWLRENHLHKRLWESLVDGESYVRATSLQALPALVGCNALWEDVLKSASITQADVLRQLSDIIRTDSEAFARRAALDCFLIWLQEAAWLQDSLNSHISSCIQETLSSSSKGVPETQSSNTDQSQPDNSSQEGQESPTQGSPSPVKGSGEATQAEMGEVVMDAVATAMRDLDWEMKLGALKFWELLLQMYIPGLVFIDALPDSSVKPGETPNREGKRQQIELHCSLMDFVLRTGCLRIILQASRDEDPSVRSRACLVLHYLKYAVRHSLTDARSQIASESDSESSEKHSSSAESSSIGRAMLAAQNILLAAPPNLPNKVETGIDTSPFREFDESSSLLIGQLLHIDWPARLKHGEADNVEGPVSLMMDIIAAAEDKEENLLDCY